MSKFSKVSKRGMLQISTASLPDIIFMLLFFFMVVTVLRDPLIKVNVNVPDASDLTKLEKKSLVNSLYIGVPLLEYQDKRGNRPWLQLGDKFAKVEDIPAFLYAHRQPIPEFQRPGITSSLKIDQDVDMGIVSDVKTELRKQAQLKLNYSAKRKE